MAGKGKDGTTCGIGRSCNWASLVYPSSDNFKQNWLEIIGELKIECLVSPLHDKDLNPNGTPKKAHYHVVVMFPSMKTREQAREVFDTFDGVGEERVASIRGYGRYLCHLDNPEKVRYNPDEVLQFGGVDYRTIISLVTDKYVALSEILDFCDANCIVFYSDLIRWCRANRFEWFRVLCDGGTYVVKEYLKSASYEIKHNREDIKNDR